MAAENSPTPALFGAHPFLPPLSLSNKKLEKALSKREKYVA